MHHLAHIKNKIEQKELFFGCWIELSDSCVSELLGEVGFDFICIDGEHASLDRKDIQLHIMAARGTGAAAFVRVASHDPIMVKPILDMGPAGIIFPFIKNAADARQAIDVCLYPPEGSRGFGPIRALRYATIPKLQYVQEASSQLWKILQIEHVDAVNNLDEILEVDGVDALFIGLNDLSASMGLLGHDNHPELQKIYDKIAEKTLRAGKPLGVAMRYDESLMKNWIDRGVSFFSIGADYVYMSKAASADLSLARKLKRKNE